MAAQTRHAGACFIPFYEMNKPGVGLPVRKHWKPAKTGRMWEDWAIGQAYADHFVDRLKAGDVDSSALVQILSDMGNFVTRNDYCAVGFVDAIGQRLKRAP